MNVNRSIGVLTNLLGIRTVRSRTISSTCGHRESPVTKALAFVGPPY